jgi:hypothetical protein
MASIEDAALALIGAIEAARPMTPGSTVMRDWPVTAWLDTELRAGRVVVAIVDTGIDENVTDRMRGEVVVAPAAPQVTIARLGSVITVGGTPTFGDQVAIVIDSRRAVAVAVMPGDTRASLVARLAVELSAIGVGSEQSGSVLTVLGPVADVRRGARAAVLENIGQVRSVLQVTTWAPTAAARQSFGDAILSAAFDLRHVAMPDGSRARFVVEGIGDTKDPDTLAFWRRDVRVAATVTVARATTRPTILVPATTIEDHASDAPQRFPY